MHYNDLNAFLTSGNAALKKGPVALIFAEDEAEIASTVRHHAGLGFKAMVLFMPANFALDPEIAALVIRIDFDRARGDAFHDAVNAMIEAMPGEWLYYCFNTEYLFFPFCETRTVGEMLAFHTEERRDAMLTYVVDLYAGDLEENPDGISMEDALLDRSGYYAQSRLDPANHNHPKERQLDFFGGLRWRFEEHIPVNRRRIDRVALFRAQKGLRLSADHLFNDEEYNTFSCQWHHNLTAAICSFRAAKALKRNPGSTFEITSFRWHNSEPFEWHSRQLLDLGLMEPGQWF